MTLGKVKLHAFLTAMVWSISITSIDVAVAHVTDFEDLTLAGETYWNGSDEAGGFASGSAWFANNYHSDWGSWDGFAYSNITNTGISGLSGQYNAIVGAGQGGSEIYATAYDPGSWGTPPIIMLDTAQTVWGLYVTNNNYAYYALLNGDAFSKKFGGSTGDDPDWFCLTITGKDAAGAAVGTEDFYLADFRFADNSLDYIVNSWALVDLSSLGVVRSLEFTLSSSDTGAWGMNTPAYFALDTIVPEPTSLVLLALGGLWLKRKRKN